MSAFDALKATVVAQVEALYAQDPVRFARLYAAFGDHGDGPPWPTVLLGTSGGVELRALVGSAWSPPADPLDPAQGPDPAQVDHSDLAELLRAIGWYFDQLAEVYAPVDHTHDDTYAPREHDHDGRYASASHHHDDAYDAKGSAAEVGDALASHTGRTDNPHGVTLTQIGAAPAEHEHEQYQVTSQKGAPNGYASLDGSGRVPASQLPAPAYASAARSTDTGTSGVINPFAGAGVDHLVEASGVAFEAGVWTVAASGVYEISAALVLARTEGSVATLTVTAGGVTHTLAGVEIGAGRRIVGRTLMVALEEGAAISVTASASGGGTGSLTVGAGSSLNIRRVA